MSRPSPASTVERADDRHRYEILVGGRLAGLTAYRDHGEQRVFYHTEVDDAFAGQGLAARLVQEAHEEFADITGPVTPEILRRLKTELRTLT
jgi:uncharacterized protein